MKKTISIVLMLAISVLAANAYAGKMDLMLKMGLGESTNAKAMLGKSLSTSSLSLRIRNSPPRVLRMQAVRYVR